MKLIIAGSRNVPNDKVVERIINRVVGMYDWNVTEVVSGTARGVDRIGEEWAEDHNIPVTRFPAEWGRYGKSAGYIRNYAMASYGDVLLAIWDGESKGTQNMIELADKNGIKFHVERLR